MQSLQIQDIRFFMEQLFYQDTFDAFQIVEASVTTYTTFQIDGSYHPDYFDLDDRQDENQSSPGHPAWRQLRPHILELIRGKHTPLRMKIIFRLADYNTEKLLRQAGVQLTAGDINGLYLTVHYKEQELSCITGTSIRVFSLDRSLEQAWDQMVQRFFRQNKIPFTIC